MNKKIIKSSIDIKELTATGIKLKSNSEQLVNENYPIEISANVLSSSYLLESLESRTVEVNRLIAAHPNATSSLLAKIITEHWDEQLRCFDVLTRRAAIRNPNISIDDALQLASDFPDDLFLNTTLRLMVIEQPRIIDGAYDFQAFQWAMGNQRS